MGLLTLGELSGFGEADVADLPAQYKVLFGSEAACPDGWDKTVANDRVRALAWVRAAVVKLRGYDGSQSATERALEKHFKASSPQLAGLLAWHLDRLQAMAPWAGYLCCGRSSWRCSTGASAFALWCLPFFWIRLCPSYFEGRDVWRPGVLVHEWAHKYLCRLDLGYAESAGYSGHSPLRSFLNADAWSGLVVDLAGEG